MSKEDEDALKERVSFFRDTVDAAIMMADDKEELKILAVMFLTAAQRIFCITEGAEKTKAALLKYITDIPIEKTP